MDRYEWEDGAYLYQVHEGGWKWRHASAPGDAWIYGAPYSPEMTAFLREFLRLADRAEDRDALQITVEEGQEIIGELSAALAVLAGESLAPCAEPCPGHLGPKAMEAMKASLVAWRALQEGNQQAAERIRELEARVLALTAVASDASLETCPELLRARVTQLEDALKENEVVFKLQEARHRIAEMEAHEAVIRQLLRIECEELGDNDWPDDLHLADVIEKHLARPAAARIAEMEAENRRLREERAVPSSAPEHVVAFDGKIWRANGIDPIRPPLAAHGARRGVAFISDDTGEISRSDWTIFCDPIGPGPTLDAEIELRGGIAPPSAAVEGAESVFAATARDPADQPLADVAAAILSRYRPTPEEDERIANTLAASVLDGRPLEVEDLDDPERDPFDRELERLRRRATRLDALLASEEVPAWLEGVMFARGAELSAKDAADIAWRWLRQQLGGA